jgi:segregation and condensation protein B
MEKCMTEERQEMPENEIETSDSIQDLETDISDSQAAGQEPEETIDDEQLTMEESSPDSEFSSPETQVEMNEAAEESAPADSANQASSETPAEITLESVIEAVLFASDEPLTPAKLADITETSSRGVHELIKKLNEKYRTSSSAFRIEQIAGGYQMLTLNCYNQWLKKLVRARSESKLSPAALETLAIIAYKQPIIRADIEAIRGVAVGEVIRSLSYKGLVKIVGRAEVLGRPMLYGTTKTFLEVFGLNSLKDLPKIEELKKPAQ